jgi:DNA-directed RNA polymerase specialized sigma24 family protein
VTDHERCTFEVFVQSAEPRLRRALVAAYGADRGREATAEALAYAWEYWNELQEVNNVTGFLYRVGQSRTRQRKRRPLFAAPNQPEPWFEPSLASALEELTDAQRSAVVLIHGFGWTLREVAECTGVKVTTVQNHLERGLKKLRMKMKVEKSDV